MLCQNAASFFYPNLQRKKQPVMPTKHLLIKGKVQGVFFRATARDVAQQLGIAGWIRNTEEGHVEALVSGTDYQVNDFISWCWQGPPGAVVTAVEVADAAPEEMIGFTILRRR